MSSNADTLINSTSQKGLLFSFTSMLNMSVPQLQAAGNRLNGRGAGRLPSA